MTDNAPGNGSWLQVSMETRAGSSKQCQLAGVGWGTERGAEAEGSWGPGSGGWAVWRGHDIDSRVHIRATSANSLPGLLTRVDEGPTVASRGRERWHSKGFGGGDVGSPPTPSLRLQPTQQLTHNLVTPIQIRRLQH